MHAFHFRFLDGSTSYRISLQSTVVEDRAASGGVWLRGSLLRSRSFRRLGTRTVRTPRRPAKSWQTSLHLRIFLAGFIYDLSREQYRLDPEDPRAQSKSVRTERMAVLN